MRINEERQHEATAANKGTSRDDCWRNRLVVNSVGAKTWKGKIKIKISGQSGKCWGSSPTGEEA